MFIALDKVGLIFSNLPSYTAPLKETKVKLIEGMRKLTKVEIVLRKLHLSLTSFGLNIWLSRDLNKVTQCDTIILFANKYTLLILKYLLKKYPKKKYIFWYWNPVDKCVDPSLIPTYEGIKICTFDMEDAKKYDLQFVETFSITPLFKLRALKEGTCKYDIYFIGQDKGRIPIIEPYIKEFEKQRINYLIQVIKDSSSESKDFKFSKKQPYSKVMEYINSTKCLLDIVQPGQRGLTQRVFDAMVMNKKLITNNRSIIHTKLYNHNMIFVLGVDKIEDLRNFINTPCSPLNKEIMSFYSLEGWLNRLLSNSDKN